MARTWRIWWLIVGTSKLLWHPGNSRPLRIALLLSLGRFDNCLWSTIDLHLFSFSASISIQYQHIIGKGAYGVACLIQKSSDVEPPRKFVVKRSITERDVATIENELEMLRWLSGAKHSVQMITLPNTNAIERYLPGTILILKHLNNRTLGRFRGKIGEHT